MERWRVRRGSAWAEWEPEITAGIASVRERGFCWATWQPQVVALAAPVVVADHPIYVLNMSVTGDADPIRVVERLSESLLNLAERVRGLLQEQ